MLREMSYNLKFASDEKPHSWPERRPVMNKLFQSERPDIIGTQEGLYRQIRDIEHDMPVYNWIGLGREGGSRGEFMAVFFDKNRFTPLAYDHLWLSDTPYVIGSISWGNTIPRMVTWVRFVDRHAGQQFYVINTHFDHLSSAARERSSTFIIDLIDRFNPKLPILITGDFNTGPETGPYDTLVQQGHFQDLWKTAARRTGEELGTFCNYDDASGGGRRHRIDWIMSRGAVTARALHILNFREDGQYPSDHFPVLAEVDF
jgi:endonuclease/exonuclease/phosphatase family metal-dependent hydrolase